MSGPANLEIAKKFCKLKQGTDIKIRPKKLTKSWPEGSPAGNEHPFSIYEDNLERPSEIHNIRKCGINFAHHPICILLGQGIGPGAPK